MNGDRGEERVRGMDWSEITIFGSVAVCIAAIHYLLVIFELGVVRDDAVPRRYGGCALGGRSRRNDGRAGHPRVGLD